MYRCNECGYEFETPIRKKILREIYRKCGDGFSEAKELEEMDTCPKCESEDIRNENNK